jgi:tetratricopeptide (TPR) repeat protein
MEKIPGGEANYATTVNNLGTMYLAMGKYPRAIELKEEASQLEINLVKRNFTFLSERQRSSYWNTMVGSFEYAYSLSWFYPVPEAHRLNYNNVLFSKGLLLRSAVAFRNAVNSSGDPSLISLFEELGRLRQQINNFRQSGGNEGYIRSLESQAEDMERSLLRDSPAYQDLLNDMAMTWRTVQQALKDNEAAIEFVSFRLYDKGWTDLTLYAALLLRPGMEAPL